MPQDAFTLKYLCEELNDLLKGGKVNKITEPTSDDVYFTIWTGKKTYKLHLSVNPSSARIGVSDKEPESPLTAPNFCMLLRKHLLNATLENISLVGFDRIVKIDFLSSNEFFDGKEKSLYAELMGRYSNLILTENGKVLGGNRGINSFDDGVRPLIVGLPYVFPPKQNKLEPKDRRLLQRLKDYAGGNLEEFITDNVQGLAKPTVLQIVSLYKATSDGNDFSPLNFFEHINNFVYFANKRPCVQVENGVATDFFVFPYKTEIAEYKERNSLVLAESEYYADKKSFKEKREISHRISSVLNAALKKAKRKVAQISAKKKSAEDFDEDRRDGELILSNIYLIKSGADSVKVYDYYENTERTIVLDEKLSPSQNAESYFKKYSKKKRTLAAIEPQLKSASEELQYLTGVEEETELCESIEDYKLILEELKTCGLIKENKKERKRTDVKSSFREYFIEGFAVKVGRNNVENDKLTGQARPDSIWMHSKDFHSSHLIIETAGKSVKESVLVKCAEICAYYSKGRNGGKTEIIYTEKKNVKKPPKSPLGFCVYERYKSIICEPNVHSEFLKNK